jgi:tRNA (cytidine56-2'-O)-methyltransferase
MDITIFRFGHRIERDKRITTHCALVSRAFGCKKLFYSGQEDNHFENSIKEVCEDFGGNLKIEFISNYEKFFEQNKSKYYIAHLTMYGIDFKTFAKKIKKEKITKPLLIFIGSQKVPSEIYQLADANVCVTNQPHSEVAALGLLLNELVDYKKVKFPKAKLIVKENPKGKTIIKN